MSLRARLRATVGSLRIDVELDTSPGVLVVVGPNGAGKTSLLSLLLGALPVEHGRIEVSGEVLLDTDAKRELPLERRRLGYVPQDYALFPHLRVRENVRFALDSAPERLTAKERNERTHQALAELELEAFAERWPETLSGGEKQRVALARALSLRPRALLLDEPLAALDVHARAEVREFLATTLERLALPALCVTHDARDAERLGARVAVLEAGRFTQVASFEELAAHPATPFVRAFTES